MKQMTLLAIVGASFALVTAEEEFMENYQEAQKSNEWSTKPTNEWSAKPTEDEFTKSIEEYTGSIPSSAYLGVAVGAMGLSLLCQVTGQGKWGNFIAQWVPTWLIIGLYNKMVKLEGHDQTDRGSAAR